MIAGISGHQDLGDKDAQDWVDGAIDAQLQRHNVVHGLTSLALGADQLFARILSRRGHSFDAVIPCDGYEATFSTASSRGSFQALLNQAAKIYRLPFSSPTEDAFLAAGEWIVRHCELLVVVWDGLPARGIGGTADVAAIAQRSQRRWIHVNPLARSVHPSSL